MLKKRRLLLILLPIVLLSGCATLKDSRLAKFYHNVTARYNGYFNAREIMKNIETQLGNAHANNYDEVLDIYPIGTEDAAKQINQNADNVIKKCTRVIQRHESSKLVDDCYFLIGKAYFYKRDYFAAIETFRFINTKFNGEELSYRSLIWLVRCEMELDKLNESLALISLINSEKEFPPELKKELNLVSSALFIRLKDYKKAITPLQEAIPEEEKRAKKTRYMFILGQILQRGGNCNAASDLFEDVIKRNPEYEMAFHSKIRLAQCFRMGSGKKYKEVKEFLLKMLEDDKNLEFFDRIYFELAQIELARGNIKEAKEYLQKTLRAQSKGKSQKALAYMALGDYYYGNKEYLLAKSYYDSTTTLLKQDDEGYEKVMDKKEVLDRLAENLGIISQQDSLLKLSKLPVNELNKRIEKQIKEEKKLEEEKKKALSQQQVQNEANLQDDPFLNKGNNQKGLLQNLPSTPAIGSDRGNWYFYNPMTLARGYNQFQKKWGDRKLEDNWRRIKKEISEGGGEVVEKESAQIDTLSPEKETEKFEIPKELADVPEDKKRYYYQIPFSQAQKDAANQKIMLAMITSGKVYYEGLNDYPRAIEMFNGLNEKYPDNPFLVQSWYYLHKSYLANNNIVEAEKYKKLILENYPESEYALLLGSKSKKPEKGNPKLESLYRQTYLEFNNDNCAFAEQALLTADTQFTDNYLKPKFEYLITICKGRKDSTEEFIKRLQMFIRKYPYEEVTAHAQNTLNYLLNKDKPREELKTSEVEMVSPYSKPDPKIPHHYGYQFHLGLGKTNQIKQHFSDYNSRYYELKKLNVKDFLLNNKHQLIIVTGFSNKEEALKYYKGIMSDNNFRQKLNVPDANHFIISVENLKILLKEKDIKGYMEFFNFNYLENKEKK